MDNDLEIASSQEQESGSYELMQEEKGAANGTRGLPARLKNWLGNLSFRTGLIVLLSCIPFYIVSFVQFALPLDMRVKTALWILFFGLAKTAQYGGLTILGAKGIERLREWWKKRKASLPQ